MHVWIGLADNNKQGSSATDIAGWTPYHTPPFSDLVKDFVWVDPGCNGSSLLASTDYLLSGYTQYGGVNEYFSANSTSHGGYCTALQFCPGVENSAAITFMPCDYKTAFMCTEQLVTPPLTPDRGETCESSASVVCSIAIMRAYLWCCEPWLTGKAQCACADHDQR
jgi:hypothetical protein